MSLEDHIKQEVEKQVKEKLEKFAEETSQFLGASLFHFQNSFQEEKAFLIKENFRLKSDLNDLRVDFYRYFKVFFIFFGFLLIYFFRHL